MYEIPFHVVLEAMHHTGKIVFERLQDMIFHPLYNTCGIVDLSILEWEWPAMQYVRHFVQLLQVVMSMGVYGHLFCYILQIQNVIWTLCEWRQSAVKKKVWWNVECYRLIKPRFLKWCSTHCTMCQLWGSTSMTPKWGACMLMIQFWHKFPAGEEVWGLITLMVFYILQVLSVRLRTGS